MMTRRTIVAGIVGFSMLLVATAAIAELPKAPYDKLKAQATDVLKVKITSVEQKGKSDEQVDLVLTAEVVKVQRGKTKVGASIQIASYHWIVPYAGPANSPLLKAGWTGTIYLNAMKDGKPYKLAAYGESFVADASRK